MNIKDLPTLGHLRDTALAANGLIADVAVAAAEAIEATLPRPVTLPVTGWTGATAPYSQTVSVAGVLADEAAQLVHIYPADLDAWEAAGAKCTAQGAGMLTFTAKEKPGGNLKIFVVLQEVVG